MAANLLGDSFHSRVLYIPGANERAKYAGNKCVTFLVQAMAPS